MWLLLIGIGIGLVLFTIAANFVRNERKVERTIVSPYGIDDPQFPRSAGALLGPPLLPGNAVTELLNGDAIFASMLDAIRSARATITFETYIYWSGDIGKTFANVLSERARAGIKVRILLDWAGSVPMASDLLDALESAGCHVVRYHAPHWYHLTRFNNRTHRKVLIIDGCLGFTGGVGIADKWTGHAQDPNHWRDTHFQVEGPVVAQMQAVFMANWIKARGVVEHTGDFFPALAPAGPHLAQMLHSSPDEGSENIRLMYLLSIAAARRSIFMSQAYFVPDDLAIDTLVSARHRGVDIEIIVPGDQNDSEQVRRAGRSRWRRLLEAGVRIYEYTPTTLHAKIMIVDGLWSSVGSTNFDNRSFRLNDEANLNIYDTGFAEQLTRTHEEDKRHTREVTLAAWRSRSLSTKLADRFWALFRQQM
jgi:cardiolipin synthase A/B